MKHTMVILDRDTQYADKAAGYINNRAGFPFEVVTFNRISEAEEYEKKQGVDILLVSEDMADELSDHDITDNTVILSGNSSMTDMGCKVIYKYQSCENIVKELLLYASGKENLGSLISRKSRMKIVGFYSPIGRSGQTGIGLSIGQILAKNHRVLFLDMDCHSNLKDMLDIRFSGDLSDLIYAMNDDSKDLATLIGGISGSLGGLDIVVSMDRHSDLISIAFKEWQTILKQIEYRTDYEYILLDLSKAVQGLGKLMAMCNKLIVTVIDDDREKGKLQAFLREFDDDERVAELIKEVTVPLKQNKDKDRGFASITGEIGECAKEIVKEIVA